MIPLVLCGRSLSSCTCFLPLILMQASWIKCPHFDQWQKTYCKQIMLIPAGVGEFLQAFFIAIICHKALKALRALWLCWSSLLIGPCLDSNEHPWPYSRVHNRERGFCSERRLLRETVLQCVPECHALSRLHYQHHHKAYLHCQICRLMHAFFFAARSTR